LDGASAESPLQLPLADDLTGAHSWDQAAPPIVGESKSAGSRKALCAPGFLSKSQSRRFLARRQFVLMMRDRERLVGGEHAAVTNSIMAIEIPISALPMEFP
jgi:hypothetical protein